MQQLHFTPGLRKCVQYASHNTPGQQGCQ